MQSGRGWKRHNRIFASQFVGETSRSPTPNIPKDLNKIAKATRQATSRSQWSLLYSSSPERSPNLSSSAATHNPCIHVAHQPSPRHARGNLVVISNSQNPTSSDVRSRIMRAGRSSPTRRCFPRTRDAGTVKISPKKQNLGSKKQEICGSPVRLRRPWLRILHVAGGSLACTFTLRMSDGGLCVL